MRATRRSRRQGALADGHPDLERPFHAAMQAASTAPRAMPPEAAAEAASAESPGSDPDAADDPWSLRVETFVAVGKRVPRPKPATPRAGRRPRVEALHDLDPRLWPDAGS